MLPGAQRRFEFRLLTGAGSANAYAYGPGQEGKVLLEGDNGVELAVAFNQYLRDELHADFDWLATAPLAAPGALPVPAARVGGVQGVNERFFLNYCTYGYTMPWWGWDRWQRFIDWMAMNGINEPMLQVGQEATWLEVWKSYGMSEAQVLAYFTGPAHLPWHRMANIDRWEGPLPRSWIDGQRAMQVRILARSRELGIKPILSAFAGHVPAELAKLKPQAKITGLKPGWGGFAAEYATSYLSPDDPLFADIQVRFLKAQEKMYGTDHLYATDPFNEMTPPSYEPAYLASVGKAIYGSMAAADPDAKWYQMTWTFTYDKHWTNERLGAMCRAVPLGRMVLLDYVGEEHELYKQTNDDFGLPFVWNYLGNFGGTTHILAPIHRMQARAEAAMQVKNCVGLGSTLEGFGAEPGVYELLLEQAMRVPRSRNVEAWAKHYADERSGGADPAVEAAWSELIAKVFLDNATAIGTHGVVFQEMPELGRYKGRPVGLKVPYQPADLVDAVRQLLRASPESQKADGYQYDLINFTRQSLGDLGMVKYAKIEAAIAAKDPDAVKRAGDEFLALGQDLDRLLATRHEFLLGEWIGDARAWGTTPAEKDYYEENARRIITTWQKPLGSLTDYAARQRNGLIRDYYLPRWQKWLALEEAALRGKQAFPKADYAKWVAGDAERFLHATNSGYLEQPQGDAVATARELFTKYFPE